MSKKLAYYTAFFGDNSSWVNIIPPLFSAVHDCYFFTNNAEMYDRLGGTKWIRVFLDIPIKTDYALSAMDSKELKLCPHRFEELQSYEFTCWLDSTLIAFDDKISPLLDKLDGYNIVLTRHPAKFSSVWDEYRGSLALQKHQINKDRYLVYINSRLGRGFSEITDCFHCTGFILRRTCDEIADLNELWLEEVKECGINCQICFHFVKQIHGLPVMALEFYQYWDYNQPGVVFKYPIRADGTVDTW